MTDLEAIFLFWWTNLARMPEPVQEYRFHTTRQWRFDFAWPDELVAVECEGGIWSRGRHVRGAGYRNDCEKYNAAAAAGWRVFRCTGGMLAENPQAFITMVHEAVTR